MAYILQVYQAEVSLPDGTYAMRAVRNWSGLVMSKSDGSWMVDYSKADMTEVMNVVATAQANTSNVALMPFTTIRSFDNKSAIGGVLVPNTLNFFLGGSGIGMKMAAVPTAVYVQVIGY